MACFNKHMYMYVCGLVLLLCLSFVSLRDDLKELRQSFFNTSAIWNAKNCSFPSRELYVNPSNEIILFPCTGDKTEDTESLLLLKLCTMFFKSSLFLCDANITLQQRSFFGNEELKIIYNNHSWPLCKVKQLGTFDMIDLSFFAWSVDFCEQYCAKHVDIASIFRLLAAVVIKYEEMISAEATKVNKDIKSNGSTTGTVDGSEDDKSMNATVRLTIDKTVNGTGNEPPEHASDKGNGSTTGTVDGSEDDKSKNATVRLTIDKTVNSTGNEPPEHASDKVNTVTDTSNIPPKLTTDNGDCEIKVKGRPIPVILYTKGDLDDIKQHEDNTDVDDQHDTGSRDRVPLHMDIPPTGHFMAYFITICVLCVAGYVIYLNKQKILALIMEGRRKVRRRQCLQDGNGVGTRYTKLHPSVEETLSSLDKVTTSTNYIY